VGRKFFRFESSLRLFCKVAPARIMGDMDILFLIVIILGFASLAYLVTRKTSSTPPELLEIVKMLQASSGEDRKLLLDNLSRSSESLNVRLDAAARLLSDVQKNVGEMSEIGRSMRDLQQFLKSPKVRGNVGEHILKELLSQSLPKDSFHLQYAFRSGEKVDAAIKTSGGLIPIDSKFPMENFQKMASLDDEIEQALASKAFARDIKIHIDAISKKYIVTDEGTIDYALMYIPSEAVYYEVVNNGDLFDYAQKKRVLPVSPTTFYAYLKAILMSFEGQKIEVRAKEILNSLRAMQKDYTKVEENLTTLQKHLMNASNMMIQVTSGFGSLGQKISQTRNLDPKDTPLLD